MGVRSVEFAPFTTHSATESRVQDPGGLFLFFTFQSPRNDTAAPSKISATTATVRHIAKNEPRMNEIFPNSLNERQILSEKMNSRNRWFCSKLMS